MFGRHGVSVDPASTSTPLRGSVAQRNKETRSGCSSPCWGSRKLSSDEEGLKGLGFMVADIWTHPPFAKLSEHSPGGLLPSSGRCSLEGGQGQHALSSDTGVLAGRGLI